MNCGLMPITRITRNQKRSQFQIQSCSSIERALFIQVKLPDVVMGTVLAESPCTRFVPVIVQ
jgi:hypothetical protein